MCAALPTAMLPDANCTCNATAMHCSIMINMSSQMHKFHSMLVTAFPEEEISGES